MIHPRERERERKRGDSTQKYYLLLPVNLYRWTRRSFARWRFVRARKTRDERIRVAHEALDYRRFRRNFSSRQFATVRIIQLRRFEVKCKNTPHGWESTHVRTVGLLLRRTEKTPNFNMKLKQYVMQRYSISPTNHVNECLQLPAA